ncbi:hypothetical protein DERP_003476 [Dermatophagoides pteronyssinus]|uniref:Secreted protein n=1 Tax=Dermatophagoides pteronyssinus TaxID=6956 RepID=A0ABQ8JKR1_DERPT|nr:hypothetical protein DERP_003476 [Dermatophagoides pteronyssinus]
MIAKLEIPFLVCLPLPVELAVLLLSETWKNHNEIKMPINSVDRILLLSSIPDPMMLTMISSLTAVATDGGGVNDGRSININ